MDGNRAMGVITIATIDGGVMDSGTAATAPPPHNHRLASPFGIIAIATTISVWV
jgi:hypothetical protein